MLIGAKSCRTCEFRHKQGNMIFCTRNPPQIYATVTVNTVHGPQPAPVASYAPVNPDIPCGEYRRSEAFATQEVLAS